jgi:hypothetical protein
MIFLGAMPVGLSVDIIATGFMDAKKQFAKNAEKENQKTFAVKTDGQ